MKFHTGLADRIRKALAGRKLSIHDLAQRMGEPEGRIRTAVTQIANRTGGIQSEGKHPKRYFLGNAEKKEPSPNVAGRIVIGGRMMGWPSKFSRAE